MAEAFAVARPSWFRRTLFFGSIGAHGVAAVALVIYSVFHVEELPPPEITLTFFNAPPPPPPPPPPAGAQQKKAPTKPKIVPVKNTALKEPKPEPKEEPQEEQSSGQEGGQPGGVPGGVAGGVVGGVVGAPPTAAPPPPPPAPPKMVPSFVFDKQRLSSPDPRLSDPYKDRHPKQSVTATYRICVGPDGRITEVSVIRGLGGTEDDHVIRQLRATWRYKPQPLPVCSVRNFVFNIK